MSTHKHHVITIFKSSFTITYTHSCFKPFCDICETVCLYFLPSLSHLFSNCYWYCKIDLNVLQGTNMLINFSCLKLTLIKLSLMILTLIKSMNRDIEVDHLFQENGKRRQSSWNFSPLDSLLWLADQHAAWSANHSTESSGMKFQLLLPPHPDSLA